MFETDKYYLCKERKIANNEELNAFIQKVFCTDYKCMSSHTSYRPNLNYYDYYGSQVMIEFHVGGIYKCMMDNYLKDDNGQLVYIGRLDGFLFEEVKIDLHGCEKIIGAIEKHYGCFASVEPFNYVDCQHIAYMCNVKLHSVNGNNLASSCTFSNNPVNGLLIAYRSARKALAQNGKLNKAIHGDSSYIYAYTHF